MYHPSVSDIVSALREKCQKNGEPPEWLAGLLFAWQGDRLIISFLHPFFAAWFMAAKKDSLELMLADILGKDAVWQLEKGAFPAHAPQARAPDTQGDPFADFLDNGQNALALACARSIAENREPPAITLFLGESASGKTALLRAMARAFSVQARPAVMARAASFLRSSPYLSPLRPALFWQAHAVLLLDDLQAIADDGLAQEQLAEVLDCAPHDGRLVFAWRGTAAGLGRLSPSLRRKLEKGAAFLLQKADLATRLKYIEKTAQKYALPLKRETILFLARQGQELTALHGFLEKIRAFRGAYMKMPDDHEIGRLLESQAPASRLDWKIILEKVCAKLQVDPAQCLEDSRKPDILQARQVAMYLCRTRLGLSFKELGRLFGGKDHSTVMHSVGKVEKLRDTHKVTRNLLTELEQNLS